MHFLLAISRAEGDSKSRKLLIWEMKNTPESVFVCRALCKLLITLKIKICDVMDNFLLTKSPEVGTL
jgi:hypothetical protein